MHTSKIYLVRPGFCLYRMTISNWKVKRWILHRVQVITILNFHCARFEVDKHHIKQILWREQFKCIAWMEHYLFPSDYLTFAEGMDTLWDTFRPFTALSMKRNTKKLPSIPAVKTYLSSKLVFMCRIPPWWLSCTLSAQKLLKFSKSFDPSRGWIRRTPSSMPKRRNLPEWLKNEREILSTCIWKHRRMENRCPEDRPIGL